MRLADRERDRKILALTLAKSLRILVVSDHDKWALEDKPGLINLLIRAKMAPEAAVPHAETLLLDMTPE